MTNSAATDDTASAARALVVGHGDFAAGIVSAVEQIGGCGDRFVALSNRNLGLQELEAAIVAQVDLGARLVFTDLPAGSTTVAARRAQRQRADLVVATGASLAMLLEFALGGTAARLAAAGDVASAAQQAVDRGRAAMQVVAAPATPGTSGTSGTGAARGT